jgi:hypothetical protein
MQDSQFLVLCLHELDAFRCQELRCCQRCRRRQSTKIKSCGLNVFPSSALSPPAFGAAARPPRDNPSKLNGRSVSARCTI